MKKKIVFMFVFCPTYKKFDAKDKKITPLEYRT